jgi:hypothetical protein
MQLRVNKQAYHGNSLVTSDEKIRVEKTIDCPERHWWIISDGLLESLEPPLREHADLFDLILALNLCTDDPVVFSQSPGQVVGGAYSYDRGALEYRDDLQIGNFATALASVNEIPKRINIDEDPRSIFENVREYRSKRLESDAEVDIRVALHMYDDALTADLWTTTTNLYYVCENVLGSGQSTKMDSKLAENTDLTEDEATSWRSLVNRLKHPDKGDDVRGFLDQENSTHPSILQIRRVANTVLKDALESRSNYSQ